MSTTIDQKVVEMRFDNQRFERNVATTMSTLDKLKEKLHLKGASKGLEDVDAAAKKVNMAGLGSAIEGVSAKFSALQVMGVTALMNITNSAVNAGKRIASALTIDPIRTGLQEYETQINAVQTILANTESKGTTLDDVNSALDTLNTYADKTIYNFTEMTRNIGTFTAAGVDLDTSVNAIQGIANLAAVSGSSSQQASTAMYQLSQALASGTVKLMDWNSVVNAGMGGQVFQDALKETARVHGINIDAMIKKNGSFRETLQEGWLTSDILTETLEKFTMATEGLSEAEIEANRQKLKSIGYTDEQIEGIFKLGNTATNAATKVKTATQLFDTLKETAQSGWTQTWEIIFGGFEDAKTLFSGLYETFAPILEASAKARNELLQGWADAGGRDDLIESVYNIVDAIGSVVKPIKEAFREIFPPATAEKLANITRAIKEFTAKLTLSDEASDKLKRTFKGLFAILDIVKQAFSAAFSLISPLFGKVSSLGGGILGVTAKIGDWIVALNESVKSSNAFGKVVDLLKNTLAGIAEFFKPLVNGVKEFGSALSNDVIEVADKARERFQPLVLLGGLIKSVFTGIGNILKKVAPYVLTAASAVGSVIKNLINTITSSIKGADYDKVFDIANGGILAAIGVFIAKFIKSGGDILDNAGGFLENINNILGGVGDALGAFTERTKAETLQKIAIAIGILAASLLVLSLIDSEKLTTALFTITTLFAELMASMSIFSKIGNVKGAGKFSALMISLAASLLVLSAALKIMSTMSWKEMGVGLISMTVSLGALIAAVNLLPDRKVDHAAKSIKKMSTAILVLAVGIKIMSTMSWKEMGVGLITMATGLGALVAAVNLLPDRKVNSASRAIKKMSTAILILAVGIKIMSTMSWKEMGVGLISMAAGLGALVAAVHLLPRDTAFRAAGMVGLATAMVILGGALKIMATMSWTDVGKSLAALAGSLLIIATAMAFMKSAIPGAAALLVIAASLTVLAPVLMLLGSMSLAEIGKSLLMLAGVFTVLGLSALVLKPLVPTILALAGAITLFGLSCVAIGAGVLMIGAGLTALAAALAASGGAIVVFVSSIISLIPYAIEQFGLGIINFCNVISGSVSAIAGAFSTIVLAIIDALVTAVPALAEGLLVLIESLLESLVKHTPAIVASLCDFLISLIYAIADKLPALIKAGVDLVMAFFAGVIEALQGIDPDTLLKGVAAVGLLTALMAALAAVGSMTGAAMVGVLGLGVVIAELALVLAAIGVLAQIPGLEWLISEGGKFMQAVGTAIGQFIGGIVGGVAKGMTTSLPQIGSDLSAFMTNVTPFIEGAKLINPAALDGVYSLVGVVLALTAANFLDGIASWLTGSSSITKFGEQLPEFGSNLKLYSDAVSGIDNASVVASAKAAKALADMTNTIPNEGGMVSWFVGNKSVSKFGEDLVKLGESLMQFSSKVSGIDAGNVTAAADAAKALAEMANTVPNEGGMVSWFEGDNSVAAFGEELVSLGGSLTKFSESVAGINAENVAAATNAAKALAEMANTIPNTGGMVTWFTGDNSVAAFGEELVSLGESLLSFSNSVSGINPTNIVAAANAAKALTDMANTIPNSGGMVAWFTGDNSVAAFGDELVVLGESLLSFSNSVSGINPTNIVAAANAAKALTDMANTVPNSGGIVAWFAGDNSIAAFGDELKFLGVGLKDFSDSVVGINAANITAAANAAKALAEMANTVPDSGGMVAWFTGENSIAKFGDELESLGIGLSKYSAAITGFKPEAVIASANAAKVLADMTNTIPNEGGMVSWFTGEKSISKFGGELESLGKGLKKFSDETSGIKTDTVTAAANAAKSLADMTNAIPNEGGMGAWFVGEKSISKFGNELVSLGQGLKKFSDEVVGINPENVTAAGVAAKGLADLTNAVPSEGGMVSWFTGEKSISKFSNDLVSLGKGLKGFSDETSGIAPETVTAAANAAKALAEMANAVPDTGGMVTWFTGDNNVGAFANQFPALGEGLKAFSDSVAGINAENVTAGANAAKAIAEMANSIPNTGGMASWFSGDKNVGSFAYQFPELGRGIKGFSDAVAGINPDNVTAAANALNTLSQVCVSQFMTTVAGDMAAKITVFVAGIKSAALGLQEFYMNTKDVDTAKVTSVINTIASFKALNDVNAASLTQVSDALKSFVDSYGALDTINPESADNLSTALTNLSKINVGDFVTTIKNASSEMETAAAGLMDSFTAGVKSKNDAVKSSGGQSADKLSEGMTDKKSDITEAGKGIINSVASEITKLSSLKSSGKSLGSDLGSGLVKGIKSKEQAVYDAAYALGQMAVQGEKDGQQSNSPSKLTTLAGRWLGEGLVIGMDLMATKVYTAGSNLGKTATNTISEAISRISDTINSDIDTQPTIRPVLDLTSVRSGASMLTGMLDMDSSVSVRTNIGAISSMMSGRGQNGGNAEVISALDKLGKKLDNINNPTYMINGVTYDDGSNISDAVGAIVRAARIERRV